MNTHFITYGDGGKKYTDAADRITDQAHETNWFKSITRYDLCALWKEDKKWFIENSEFIDINTRGNGYWIWKPQIIAKKLQQIEENDILVYLDAGCEFNPVGHDRFLEYIRLASIHGLVAFYLNGPNYKIHQWTKQLLLEKFHIGQADKILHHPQIESGIIFIKNNPKSKKFIDDWAKISIENNYKLIDDHTDIESHGFIEHRHDQSIFTLLCHYSNFGTYIRNENYFPNLWDKSLHPSFAPIAALRNLSLKSKLAGFKLF